MGELDYIFGNMMRQLMIVGGLVIVAIFVIGLFSFFFRGQRRRRGYLPDEEDWHLQIALSKEDATSQLFFLLSFFFLGVTLISLNKDLGSPLAWYTVILIASLIGLAGGYFLRILYILPFGLMGVVLWWSSTAGAWVSEKNIQSSSIVAGLSLFFLFLYVLGHLYKQQKKYKRMSVVYMALGIVYLTALLFFFSTKLGLGFFAAITSGAIFFGSWQLSLSLLVIFVALSGSIVLAVNKRLITPYELFGLVALASLFGIIAFLPEQNVFLGSNREFWEQELSYNGVVWAVIFNFGTFLELLALIFMGYTRHEKWLVNLGAFFLFVLIIVKYFDWFFTFLDKSAFFISAGIIFFIVGWLMERGRRYMISSMRKEPHETSKNV